MTWLSFLLRWFFSTHYYWIILKNSERRFMLASVTTKKIFKSRSFNCLSTTIFLHHSTKFDNRKLQTINLGNNKFLVLVTRFSCLGTNLYTEDNEDVVFSIKEANNPFGAIKRIGCYKRSCLWRTYYFYSTI